MNEQEYKKYWDNRASKEKAKTVGYAGDTQEQHDARTEEWIGKFGPRWEKHFNKDGKTLDFGCGVARFTKHLPGLHKMGIDMTESLLEIAMENNPDINFRLMLSPSVIPVHDQHFDNIWVCTVLQHIVVPEVFKKIVGDLHRILAPGGTILLYENTHFKDKLMGHIHFRSFYQYVMKFKEVGFKTIKYIDCHVEPGGEKHTLFKLKRD